MHTVAALPPTVSQDARTKELILGMLSIATTTADLMRKLQGVECRLMHVERQLLICDAQSLADDAKLTTLSDQLATEELKRASAGNHGQLAASR